MQKPSSHWGKKRAGYFFIFYVADSFSFVIWLIQMPVYKLYTQVDSTDENHTKHPYATTTSILKNHGNALCERLMHSNAYA